MSRFALPIHPHLLILRAVATVEISLIIGQAGWAAAFLGGQRHYMAEHRAGAVWTLVACLLAAVVYAVLHRAAGAVNLSLAVILALLVVVQYELGRGGAVSAHVFCGVLTAMVVTALTSWTYRRAWPADRPRGAVERTRPA